MDPLPGQPSAAGWYWVIPGGMGSPKVVQVEWNAPDGLATLIQQLHIVGYTPSATSTDIWYGPIDEPPRGMGLQNGQLS